MPLKEKNCVICDKTFVPYSSSQKQCGSEECKLEMFKRNSYSKRRYKLSDLGIKKMWTLIEDMQYPNNTIEIGTIVNDLISKLEFTMDDLEKQQ